jgi:hypothetical protein
MKMKIIIIIMKYEIMKRINNNTIMALCINNNVSIIA